MDDSKKKFLKIRKRLLKAKKRASKGKAGAAEREYHWQQEMLVHLLKHPAPSGYSAAYANSRTSS